MIKSFCNLLKNKVSRLASIRKNAFDEKKISEIVKNLHHVAVIVDGNRRWAKDHGFSPLEGHNKGIIEIAPDVAETLWGFGIHTVTLWCFSTGNWERSENELNNLMMSFDLLIKKMLIRAKDLNFRIIHLGRKDRLPNFLVQTIEMAEKITEDFSERVLNIAIDYGGPDEICRSIKKLVSQGIAIDSLTEDLITKGLDTASQPFPNPDLIIRPSEQRLSGFMPIQGKYSELYFTKTYFPDFNKKILMGAILDFGKRRRMFSK